METSDRAMVSRIRVEVRGGSMEAAERVAFQMLDHARMAGYMDGIVPQTGEYTDHFFNRPNVTGSPDDAPEVWTEMGLPYAGRVTFAFEPQVAFGGIRQYGYVTLQREIAEPGETNEGGWRRVDLNDPESLVGLTVKSEDVIVLDRRNEVNRENDGAVFSLWDSPEASVEDVIENIQRLVGVSQVDVQYRTREGWLVSVIYSDGRETIHSVSATLRGAALDAYGRSGVEVTHYDTAAPGSADAAWDVHTHEFYELNEENLLGELMKRSKTIGDLEGVEVVVGSSMLLLYAQRILGTQESVVLDHALSSLGWGVRPKNIG